MSNNSQRTEEVLREGSAKLAKDAEILKSIKQFNDLVTAEENKLLSIWGMTVLQYNALRAIYKIDNKKIGVSSREIGQELTERVPDLTRLLDRLSDKQWVIRERDKKNRRVVRSRLTQIGTELVESVELPLKELQQNILAGITQQEKEMLKELLRKLSEPKPD